MESASDSNLCVPPRGNGQKGDSTSFVHRSRRVEGGWRVQEGIPQGVSEREWNDWRWQLRHRITTLDQIKEVPRTDPGRNRRNQSFERPIGHGRDPLLCEPHGSCQPQLSRSKTGDPRIEELHLSKCDMVDPLGEDKNSPVPGLVHRYPTASCSWSPTSAPPTAGTAPGEDWWEPTNGPSPRGISMKP